MADYKQNLPMNCGGTAAVFAVYGEREKVPDSALPTLQSEGLAAVSISDFINSSPAHMTAKSVFYGPKVKVSGGSELKIEFLERSGGPCYYRLPPRQLARFWSPAFPSHGSHEGDTTFS